MSNCFFFALWRWFTKGGYLIIRKSRSGPYPHFIWAPSIEGLKVIHYAGPRPRDGESVQPFLFRGRLYRRER